MFTFERRIYFSRIIVDQIEKGANMMNTPKEYAREEKKNEDTNELFENHFATIVIFVLLFVFIGLTFILQTRKTFFIVKKGKIDDTN